MLNRKAYIRRKQRVRTRIRRQAEVGKGRMRLTVFRSGQHIYAQVIDDTKGLTLASASSLDKDLKAKMKSSASKDAATQVGKLVAERAKAAGISDVVFDRGAYLYHGRVKALAEGAREGGLSF